MKIATAELQEALMAAIARAEAALPPFFAPDEFSAKEIRQALGVSYDRAGTILKQMVKTGEAVEVGIRRRHDGGKRAMAYRLK